MGPQPADPRGARERASSDRVQPGAGNRADARAGQASGVPQLRAGRARPSHEACHSPPVSGNRPLLLWNCWRTMPGHLLARARAGSRLPRLPEAGSPRSGLRGQGQGAAPEGGLSWKRAPFSGRAPSKRAQGDGGRAHGFDISPWQAGGSSRGEDGSDQRGGQRGAFLGAGLLRPVRSVHHCPSPNRARDKRSPIRRQRSVFVGLFIPETQR